MTTRNYSSTSQQTTLTGAITSGATSMVVQTGTALLGGQSIAGGTTFTLVIDPDTALEEIVDATAVSTNTFTITRAIDGSSAQAHSAGAVVRHMAIGRDFREANTHIQASADVHGLTGGSTVVGTISTQTLTNKTLTAPTITDPIITGTATAGAVLHFEGSTVDDNETILTVVDPTQDNTITLPNTSGTVILTTATQTLTNKTLTSPTISGSPVITGLSSAGMSASSATPKDYVDSILGSATAASTSAASAATSATSADTSASSASTSASSALTSANSASTSASAAATSAASASTSASAASTSAASAAASESTVTASASAAATSAASASTSASSALTSANSAETFASTMAASVAAASASATAAATSASSAAASATAAATSASSAATSATSAAISAASAAAAVTTAIQASFIDAKGDLIVGVSDDTPGRLAAASTNGYVLTVNSATTTGLEWQEAPAGYLAPTIGTTLITSGTTVSTVAGLTLSNPTLSGTLTASSSTGVSGQYLKTTGTGVEWGTVDALPTQTGNSGKYLTTDGSSASWAAITTDPTPTVFLLMGA